MKTLLLVLIILVIAAGIYFVWPQSADAPRMEESNQPTEENMAANEPDREDVLITYTENGYSPQTVTIRKGQLVNFVNSTASQETWPASAIHPTHAIYPQKSDSDCLGSSFDACRGLKPAESWTFTFNEVGEWGFHDHLHPSKFGKVIVAN